MKFPQKVFIELLFFLLLNSSNVSNHFGGMYYCRLNNKFNFELVLSKVITLT